MAVQVMGGVQNEFGIKTAMKIHHKHIGETTDALLNISGIGTATGEAVHQDEPRPAYKHSDFPKMLYKPIPGEKGWHMVLNAAEMAEALKPLERPDDPDHGWREEPYEIKTVPVLDAAQEKKNLLDTNNQLQSQIIQMAEQMKQMQEQMLSMQNGEAKRGPGRPPKSE